MRPHKWVIAVFAVGLIGAQSAFADQMTIKQTAQPKAFSYPGVSLDVYGLKLGMSEGALKKTISSFSNYKLDPQVKTTFLQVKYKTVSMASQTFSLSMTAKDKNGGSITVFFGTPATGSKAVGIDRTLVFPNVKDAPTMKQIYAALSRKYGPVTKTELSSTKDLRLWVFQKSGLLASCPTEDAYCNFAGQGYTPSITFYMGPLFHHKQSYSDGNQVLIVANLASASEDSSRISKLVMIMSNESDKYISESSAWKQINAAAVAAYKKGQVKVATPKL